MNRTVATSLVASAVVFLGVLLCGRIWPGPSSSALESAWKARPQADEDYGAWMHQWAELENAAGLRSPEARYEAAFGLLQQEHPAEAVRLLWESAALGDAGHRRRVAHALSVWEDGSGVADPASSSLPFTLAFFFGSDGRLWAYAALFWSLVAFCAAGVFGTSFAPLLRRASVGAAVTAALTLALVHALPEWTQFAVVADGEPASLFRSASLGDDERLAQLPSGLLVLLGEGTATASRLEQPVGGWVNPERVVALPSLGL